MKKLLSVDVQGWLKEVPDIHKYYEQFGSHLPKALQDEVNALEQRLKKA